jgi:hypothetical protein
MSEEVYVRLREFLDKLPAGYPATPTGVEIKILKKMFTPEQAELTMKLSEEPEEVPAIAARTGIDETELAQRLEEMALQGCIFRVHDGEKNLYQAFQFIVGLYEFQLNNLDREYSELFEEYLPYLGLSMMTAETKQLRVIPLDSSVEATSAVATYNRARDLVKEQEFISVQQCICRKEQGLLGNECERPQEVCLCFGDFGRFYIDNGLGRQISADEALKVLDLAEESALVLCPTNSQKIEAICCCCSCCCPGLKAAKASPRTSSARAASSASTGARWTPSKRPTVNGGWSMADASAVASASRSVRRRPFRWWQGRRWRRLPGTSTRRSTGSEPSEVCSSVSHPSEPSEVCSSVSHPLQER